MRLLEECTRIMDSASRLARPFLRQRRSGVPACARAPPEGARRGSRRTVPQCLSADMNPPVPQWVWVIDFHGYTMWVRSPRDASPIPTRQRLPETPRIRRAERRAAAPLAAPRPGAQTNPARPPPLPAG